MPSLSSLNNYIDEIAMSIANIYLKMLCDIDKASYIKDDDIQIERNLDLENGFVVYQLRGNLGNKINNPDVKIKIPVDLLRGLKRGEAAYNRHVKNIPSAEKVCNLVKEYYTTMYLVYIEGKFKYEKSEDSNPNIKEKAKELEIQLNELMDRY